jgi:hypothetical protein
MTMMAFKLTGAGYGDYFSAGRLYVVFTMHGGHQVYRWTGTGSSSLYANARCRPIQVPYHSILSNFTGQDVVFSLKGGVPLGGRSLMGFSIRYSGGSRAEVYNLAPQAPENLIGVDVIGTVLTDTEIIGQFSICTGAERNIILAELFNIPMIP